jgi:hypothetical protein
MSFYLIGRIHCDPTERESSVAALFCAMAVSGVQAGVGGFEDDEKSELMAEGYTWPPGVDFRLSDASDQVDATKLWLESMSSARDSLVSIRNCVPSSFTYDALRSMSLPEKYFAAASQTRLGRAVDCIINRLGAAGGLLALVEGGVENIVYCTAKECFDDILKTILLPWDLLPNNAYVWPAHVHLAPHGVSTS